MEKGTKAERTMAGTATEVARSAKTKATETKKQ